MANLVGWRKCEFIWARGIRMEIPLVWAYSFMKFAQNNHHLFGPNSWQKKIVGYQKAYRMLQTKTVGFNANH